MNTDADESTPTPPKTRTDRLVRLGFLIVTLGIVGWLIVYPHMTKPLRGWGDDFQAALEQAEAEGRHLVVLAYDSPQNHQYKRLREVIGKQGNREAIEQADVICVQARLNRNHALAEKFDIKVFPTSLIIQPDGTVIERREGYIGEVDFRRSFLDAVPQ